MKSLLGRHLSRNILGIGLACIMASGCGGSDKQLITSGGTANDGGGNTLPAVLGKLSVGQAVPSATVTFVANDGRTLGTSAVDSDGFFGTDTAVSGNISVRVQVGAGANLQGAAPLFGTELEGFGPDSKEIVVNIPTTLMARFHERHPELTLAEARARVHQFLGIPETATLELMEDSPRAHFVHDLFFQMAAQNGGVEAYLESLLQKMERGGIHTFQPEGLAALGIKFLGGCAEGLAEDFVKDETLTGFGWASKAMGINFPFPSNFDLERRLEEISQQIDALGDELVRFESQVAYQAAIDKLGTDVVVLSNTLASNLSNAANNHKIPLRPELAYIRPGQSYPYLAELEAAFTQYSAQSILDELVAYLEGTYTQTGVDDRLERLLVKLLFPPFGIGSDLSRYNGYGAFSNTTIDQQNKMLQYYLGFLEQTALLYAEQVHNTSDATTLVNNIRSAGPYLASIAQAKKRILAQVPEPIGSDNLFIDREAGMIWYTGNLGRNGGQRTMHEAVGYASNKFAGVGPLQRWRLPSEKELRSLYHRIEAADGAKGEHDDKRARILTRWGWDISYMDNTHHVWVNPGDSGVYGLKEVQYVGQQIGVYTRFSLDTGNASSVTRDDRNDVILVHDYYAPPRDARDDQFFPPFSVGSPGPLVLTGAQNYSEAPSPTQLQLGVVTNVMGTYGGQYTVAGQTHTRNAETTAFVFENMDVTAQAVWTSSNPGMATVSNFEASQDADGNVLTEASHGRVVWQPQFNGAPLQPVTITATLRDQSASITIQPPSSVTPVLSSIQVFPYNVDLGSIFPVQQNFEAVLFYQDPVTQDAQVQSFREATAPDVAWSLTDANGVPIPPEQNSGFITTDENNLLLNNTLRTTFMLVRAIVSGSPDVVGTAPIKAGISQ